MMCPFRFVRVSAVLVGLMFIAPTPASDDRDDLQGKIDQLNSVTGDDALQGRIKRLTADPKESARLIDFVLRQNKVKDSLNYNGALILARTAHELKNLDAAKDFYRLAADRATKLHSFQKMAAAYSGWIDMLFANQKYADGEKLCQEILEMDDKTDPRIRILKASATRQMIRAVARQGKYDDALKMVNNVLENRPEDWVSLELKAWVQRESGKPDESAKTYQEVMERINKEKNLSKEDREEYCDGIRYTLAGVYVEMNKIDKAAEQLQELLKKKPDDPTYLNDLGFIWADHDTNLDDAERMIRKAVDLDVEQRLKENPDLKRNEARANAAYLDSLGWVLYKKKKYKEAKTYLEQAIEDKSAHHIEIFDHLGDTYLALGDKAEAVKAWKRGIEVAGPGKRDQERKAKVERKLRDYE